MSNSTAPTPGITMLVPTRRRQATTQAAPTIKK